MYEEWRNLAQCDKYECSNLGRIRNKETKTILKGTIDNKGYIRYDLSENGKRFVVFGHRIVAATFIPEIEEKKYVNHIDGDKTNNKTDNLEWCTNKENILHSINVLGKQVGGQNHKPIICLNTGRIYASSYEAERELGISNSLINRVCNKQRKSTHKLKFAFYENMPL